jgi:hypothetical protein
VLSPVSLVAGAIDLVTGGERPGRLFYAVLVAGRRSEHVINLFGEAERVRPRAADAGGDPSLDALVARFERLVVEQYERGGITASAKAAIDRSIDALGKVGAPKSKPEPPA